MCAHTVTHASVGVSLFGLGEATVEAQVIKA